MAPADSVAVDAVTEPPGLDTQGCSVTAPAPDIVGVAGTFAVVVGTAAAVGAAAAEADVAEVAADAFEAVASAAVDYRAVVVPRSGSAVQTVVA